LVTQANREKEKIPINNTAKILFIYAPYKTGVFAGE
jgi:hypothetical protein